MLRFAIHNTTNMAHTILVRIEVDDEYADADPQITTEDYLEGSSVTRWEVVTERVFTESEVRAMLTEMADMAVLIAMFRSGIALVADKHGITLDPA